MKNFTLKLCLIFTILSICATSFADVVFKFKTPSDWSKCHIWAWDDDNTQLASTTDWPGDAAMTLSSDGYYTYTLKTSVTKVNFLFNNGASSGTKQTVDASTTETKFMGRYGSTDTQGHYYITEETFVDTDDSGDDDVVTPDNPQPTGEVTISAIRNRLSINTNDFTDFAGLYVSELPKAGDATVSYEWQYSTDNATWTKYSAGDGATWDNIRPNKAGYYRCVISYDLAGEITTITSNTLQITNKGGNSVSFSSKLPVILVRTAKDFPAYPGNYPNIEQVEALKAKRSVDVKILWNEEGGSVTNADINNADMLHYDRKARMNYRGSSSLYNPKRSYAFVSGDKNCDAKKLGEVKTKKFGMFGAAANKDWVLYASYPDATYMRNVLTYHQYAKMTGLWGAKCKYVELYIDGSYQGIYVFMDKITQDESRINVNEDTGYIVKFDKTDIADRYSGKEGANEDYKRNTFTTSYTGRTGISTYNITVDQAFEIEYPEREDIAEFDDDGNVTNDAPWEAKVAEIKGIFENMEKAILANDYTRLATIIDYDSWADYFIMNEFSRNADAYRISCVFTVNSASDKIVANPMWDYELGWGNQDTKTSGLMVEDDQYYEDDFPTPFWWTGKGKSGCNGILGDCKFRAKVLERWEKHVGEDGALNSDVLNAKIDSLKTALSGSSTNTSVSTSSLKSWVINRTSGLNTEFNTWDACPDLKFALVGTINDEKLSTYASGIPFTMQDDGSYTAVFTASETTHNLQIITSTGDIWARNDSKDIVSTSENASSYATMTKGQTTGYANITTVANTEYTFTFKLNADGVSGKLTYTKGETETPDNPDPDDPDDSDAYTKLYLKGAITSWTDDENFRLKTADGNYYVVSYPAGQEVEISGEFKLASSDWTTLDFGGATNTPEIEAGKEYTLTSKGSNLVASGIIKASKIEFTVSTKELKITGVETVYDVEISAIRDRYSINTKDFTDFAGLYVSKLPKAGDATVSYEWQFASTGNNWVTYSAGDGATWDNIRPNVAGYYRCVLTYDLAGEVTTYTSNVISITDNGGTAVTFSSKLPVFLVRTSKDFPNVTYLDNDGVAEMKAKRSVDVKILWNEEGGAVTNADVNNADMLHYDRKARMNYRGSSSLRNDKKSYAFVTGDKNCDPKKLGEVKTKKFGMFGEAAQKDWVLYASAPDATYMRNVLSFHQYAQMTGLWGVKCRYVELYIDGSYKGIYVFMDKITQDENRVNVNEDTGFIVKFDKTDEVDSYDAYAGANEDYKRNTFLTSNTGRRHISTYDQYVDQAFEIEYPEREDIAEFDDDGNVVNDAPWEAKVAEVKGMFTAMENAILANDYDKLATIIDYESWADWFIMNEFSRNADAYRISCVFTINASGDKIVANPLWDYELGWGYQDTKTSGLMVEDNQYYNDDFPTPFWWTGKGKSGCNGILGDCKFRAIVKELWAKYIAADGALNSTVLNTKIDSLKTVLSGSSTNASVSTSSLKSWITNRTSGLNNVISAWETCPVPEISDLVAPEFAKIYAGETATGTATFSVENASSVEVVLSGDDVFSVVGETDGVVEVEFAPNASGTFSGVLTITADGVVTETINFSASAIFKPVISDLVAHEFTQIYVGETATGTATFSVANASNVEVELSGEAFSILSEADGSVEIVFTPTTAGTFNGVLTITADGVVTETIEFSASAILKLEITDLVAPEFTQIYVGETATGTATFSVANASAVEVVLSGDDVFSVVGETDGVVEVEFAPNAAGTFNGVLTITADGVVTETINFSAIAILKPEITDLVAPEFTQIYVRETATGTATFSVANASNVEVELSGEAFSILSEADGSVEIVFTPTTAGTFNGVLTITADGVVTETIEFSASAIFKPVISDLVAPIFSEIYVGETATGTATFSVANASNVEVELSGEAFSILSEADGSVEIVFTPTTAGTFNGTLTITADNVVTETINFSATAILKPVISDLVAPIFSEIYVGEATTSIATFSVENATDVEVELSGEAFSILGEADGSVEIVFTPTTAGTFNGVLTITADGVVTETINFSASAIFKPVISDLVAPIFSEIYVGEATTSIATFSVENATDVEVELSGEAFSILSEADGSVEIVFTPTTAGTFNGTLTITADGVVTETINFSASAIFKPVISDLVAPIFSEIYVGETATGTATFSVENATDVEVELSGEAFSILSEADGSVEIVFTPTTAGTFNGVLTITADNVVTETIEFSASAIFKPVILDLVAPIFSEIYVGEATTSIATFSVENATDVEVELSGEAFSILSEADGSVEIVFTPTTAGTFIGTLTITADGVVKEIIDFTAIAIEGITTDIEEDEALNIYAKEGTIYCDEEFTIYNLAGLDVTSLNGSLQGVYLVVTANGNEQISVW